MRRSAPFGLMLDQHFPRISQSVILDLETLPFADRAGSRKQLKIILG